MRNRPEDRILSGPCSCERCAELAKELAFVRSKIEQSLDLFHARKLRQGVAALHETKKPRDWSQQTTAGSR